MAEAADSGHNLGDSIDAGRGELLKVLLRHEVKFVVIGGAAIQSHGRRYVTEDIDLTPDTDETNLQRPSGFPHGYADLAPHATTMPAAGTSISVLVASLDDIHASKRAADRPKDRAYFAASE